MLSPTLSQQPHVRPTESQARARRPARRGARGLEPDISSNCALTDRPTCAGHPGRPSPGNVFVKSWPPATGLPTGMEIGLLGMFYIYTQHEQKCNIRGPREL